jgi:hypothetical protein
MIQGRDRAREHWRPDFSHAQRHELDDLLCLRRERGGKRHRVLARDPARGEQDVLITEGIGAPHDVAAMFIAAAQAAVRHAEEFVIVAAQC